MNIPFLILIVVLLYFGMLLFVARRTGCSTDNNAFFRAGNASPWPLVAFGMIGASMSGVSFVSVPGMIQTSQMTYLQMCLGFVPGYFLVAFLLLPLYYRLKLTSIYSYLLHRYGIRSYHTGAWFFLLSKTIRAAAGMFLVCSILHEAAFRAWGIPFVGTVLFQLLLIWLYTRRGGIRTLVWTDTLQTTALVGTLLLLAIILTRQTGLNFPDLLSTLWHNEKSRVFAFDNWQSPHYFWKQFLSGAFIVVVMTGLDQDMMQKNLTCRNLREAQKDMCCYAWAFVPVNLLLLILGFLLYTYYQRFGLPLPSSGDEWLPSLALSGRLGYGVLVLFILGIVAASFSSADSALTALTTCFCLDILGMERKGWPQAKAIRVRKWVHLGIVAAFVCVVLLFRHAGRGSLIDTIYVLAGYTYGPLLGLFAFGLFTHRVPRDRFVPLVAVAAPLACYGLSLLVPYCTGYRFGYELLILNGLLTFTGLYALSVRRSHRKQAAV